MEVLSAFFVVLVLPLMLINAQLRLRADKVMSVTVNENFTDADSSNEKQTAENTHKILIIEGTGKIFEKEMDTYLTSVLLCEMPMTFDIEALKAQAVVARTYVLRQQKYGLKHNGAICGSPDCCQGYCSAESYLAGGGAMESVEKARKAVAETKNIVLMYDGKLIDATYFSCSGGMTEAAQAVWGSDIPYLQATESPGEEASVHYVETNSMSAAEFMKQLNLDPLQYPVISKVTYTSGGGVETIDINGVSFCGTQVRSMLSLRSTAFAITPVGETVTITTKGFGHRVGMSQFGADAMAKRGASYDQILAHYYCGAELALIEA